MLDSDLELNSTSEVDPTQRRTVTVTTDGAVFRKKLTPETAQYYQDLENFNLVSDSSDFHYDDRSCDLGSSSEVWSNVPRTFHYTTRKGNRRNLLTPEAVEELDEGKISYLSSEIGSESVNLDSMERVVSIHSSDKHSNKSASRSEGRSRSDGRYRNSGRKSSNYENEGNDLISEASSALESDPTYPQLDRELEQNDRAEQRAKDSRKVKVNREFKKNDPEPIRGNAFIHENESIEEADGENEEFVFAKEDSENDVNEKANSESSQKVESSASSSRRRKGKMNPQLKESLKDPKFRNMAAAHIAALALAGYTTFYAKKKENTDSTD
ncbi:hypothetical protein TRFO_06085 [Tritrichomonas foetus]|uniref:Uncharacterized protein n=1 Tax=Tritrichomonas foetus TaxID=1144522 RepID=A0A1J4K287_9EUKA|nr:hypothetical protein TRFO_06085 [Tritrichomonas foetus]|eukprot:OHT05082.1 hypothetical protein TRFO_06085 [Tritrichomonas foetus]